MEFSVHAPDIDESRQTNESPEQLVYRLAQAKAKAVAKSRHGLIIASDQVATLQNGSGVDEQILGKPHTHENALKQLSECSGKSVTFITSLCLLNTNSGNIQTIVERLKYLLGSLALSKLSTI